MLVTSAAKLNPQFIPTAITANVQAIIRFMAINNALKRNNGLLMNPPLKSCAGFIR